MNSKILQKCVDALKQDNPDLSYVRGMLETLIDIDVKDAPATVVPVITSSVPSSYAGEPIPAGLKDFISSSLTTD